MISQLQFVDNLSQVLYRRPARTQTITRVAAGGLLLPIASAYAILGSASQTYHQLAHDYWYVDWFVPFMPPIVGETLADHSAAYALTLGCLGILGVMRWRRPIIHHSASLATSTLWGLVILVAALPLFWATYTTVWTILGIVWLVDTVHAGLARTHFPWGAVSDRGSDE